MKTKILKKVAATTAAFALLFTLSAPTYAAPASKLNISVGQGALTINIMDSTAGGYQGTSVAAPSVAMTSTIFSFNEQTSTGTFGTATETIRVYNRTNTPTWSASIAATSGNTATWSDGSSFVMDFNDPIAANGQLTIDPSTGTITSDSTTTTGVTLGSAATFNQGTTDSITLYSAAAGATTYDFFNLTGVSLSQNVPAQQDVAAYTLDLTLTVV